MPDVDGVTSISEREPEARLIQNAPSGTPATEDHADQPADGVEQAVAQGEHAHSADSGVPAPARSMRRATARRASTRRATARSRQGDPDASIIDYLAQHPGSTAGDLAKHLNLNPGSVSARLTQLAKAGETTFPTARQPRDREKLDPKGETGVNTPLQTSSSALPKPRMRGSPRPQRHLSYRSNWLRAAVLGANDGILSTSSLVLGVTASGASGSAIVTAGVAGLVAGSLAMAAGEFVSVSSQRDSERADLQLEERELRDDPEGELRELTSIYQARGLPAGLARQVAVALTGRDALGAHARDELGLEQKRQARPLQAAGASALAFSSGAVLPVTAVAVMPAALRALVCVAITVLALGALGFLGARLGGGNQRRATARAVGWGVLAMAITAAIGALVGGVG